MRKMKKLVSLVLALVLAFALAAPAFAATDGTITVTNATIGEDYSIYKIFSATYSGEKAAYTIKSDDAWYDLVSRTDSPFTLTQIDTTGGYNVAVKKVDDKDADVLAWLNSIETLPTATATQEDVQNTTVTFAVTYGYYLIKSSLNGGGVLTVDNATPNATVIDKNQKPGDLAKKATAGVTTDETKKDANNADVTVKSAQIDDEITYEITYEAMNYDGEKKITHYVIKDDMQDGITLVNDDKHPIDVYVGDKKLGTGEYTIVMGTSDNDDFTVTIPWVKGWTEATKDDVTYDAAEFIYPTTPTTIKITYTAKMNSGANIDDGEGNTNTAGVDYGTVDKENKKEDPDPDKKTVTETVYTYALAIKKVDKKGGAPLKDATFELTLNGTAVNVSPVKENDVVKPGWYVVDSESTSNEVVSPEGGVIVIKGLKHAQYTLTEKTAPNGYNLLIEPVEIQAERTGKTSTTITTYLDAEGNVTKEETNQTTEDFTVDVGANALVVENSTGAQLPSTGGIGTTIFYVVGGILVVGAAILLVTRKRVSGEK